MKLIKKAVDISIHNILAFPYEIYLVALYSAFSIVCTLLFWKVLFLNVMPQGYRPEFIYILAFCGLCSDGLCDVFFGLRDLDYLVRTGEFDRYLVRPRHPLYLVVLENMPIASILEKLILSVGGIFLQQQHRRVIGQQPHRDNVCKNHFNAHREDGQRILLAGIQLERQIPQGGCAFKTQREYRHQSVQQFIVRNADQQKTHSLQAIKQLQRYFKMQTHQENTPHREDQLFEDGSN